MKNNKIKRQGLIKEANRLIDIIDAELQYILKSIKESHKKAA